MEKQQLKKLINQNLSTRDIAKTLNTSQSNVRYWLKEYKLKTKFKPYRKGFSYPFKCKRCGITNQTLFYKGRKSFCKKCCDSASTKDWYDKKLKSLEYLGNKCKHCGYDGCIAALELHHRNPKEKDFMWTQLRTRPWYKIVEELNKCDLLCANCHREIHHPNTSP